MSLAGTPAKCWPNICNSFEIIITGGRRSGLVWGSKGWVFEEGRERPLWFGGWVAGLLGGKFIAATSKNTHSSLAAWHIFLRGFSCGKRCEVCYHVQGPKGANWASVCVCWPESGHWENIGYKITANKFVIFYLIWKYFKGRERTINKILNLHKRFSRVFIET